MKKLVNEVIHGFTLQHKLGEGGMADVWYAKNSFGKSAAVKILKTEFCLSSSIVSRFENEAKIMLKLNHDNIRQVYDYGTLNNRSCIIMEYLDGEDLKNKINNNEILPKKQIVEFWNICVDAFRYMHRNGVIHRDIKPSNLFVTTNNKLKILDFGIAKDKDFDNKTTVGTNMGTLLYMSPEQIKDSKNIDYKTDIYSLAVTFYHLLRGKSPYDITNSSDFEIRAKIVNEDFDLADISKDWKTFLKQYLHKAPEKRAELQKIIPNKQESDYIQHIELNRPNNFYRDAHKNRTVLDEENLQTQNQNDKTKTSKSNFAKLKKTFASKMNKVLLLLMAVALLIIGFLILHHYTNTKRNYHLATAVCRDFEADYTGIIGFTYKINMSLKCIGGKLSGTYSYVGNQGHLNLKGELENNGSFTLQEFNDLGNMTGLFKGRINANEMIGEWCKPDGSNLMSFYMTKD